MLCKSWGRGGWRIVLKNSTIFFGYYINISFELQQNAITETQMFFVS